MSLWGYIWNLPRPHGGVFNTLFQKKTTFSTTFWPLFDDFRWISWIFVFLTIFVKTPALTRGMRTRKNTKKHEKQSKKGYAMHELWHQKQCWFEKEPGEHVLTPGARGVHGCSTDPTVVGGGWCTRVMGGGATVRTLVVHRGTPPGTKMTDFHQNSSKFIDFHEFSHDFRHFSSFFRPFSDSSEQFRDKRRIGRTAGVGN